MTPTVAIVGRPNVGKSTLFNRLVGRRQAIVHDRPGVTRDRITGRAEIAPGRFVTVVDTGGLVPGDDPLGLGRQVLTAVDESELLILLVDGAEGLVPADERVWDELRRRGRPALLAVNKADTRAAGRNAGEFFRLGIADLLLVSAEHGTGVGDLREAIARALPAPAGEEAAETTAAQAPAIAIVGRPNVGKSSLVNHILGEPRVLVSPHPGTTRDPVDSLVEREGRRWLLIDTAGIRRRSRMTGTPEELAVMMARRQIERAAAVVLVLDAAEGVTSGDLAIAGAIWEEGRPAVVAANKWDLLAADSRRRLETQWPRLADLLADPPRVNLSALSGRGVAKLFPALGEALAAAAHPISTGEVNRLLAEIVARHHPPSGRGGQTWKLYYATQVATRPPTFMLFANRTLPRGDTYRRYLENRLRERLGWRGVPVRLVIRRREG